MTLSSVGLVVLVAFLGAVPGFCIGVLIGHIAGSERVLRAHGIELISAARIRREATEPPREDP